MNDIIQKIAGNTKVCAVIGEPIEHTLSPAIHNALAKAWGNNMVYVPFHVSEETLKEAIYGAHALGIKGMNVTMPHKQSIMPYLYEIDEKAKRVGAVNTLVYDAQGYIGYNTDAEGLKMSLEEGKVEYRGKNVAIIGSGGAAYAAVIAVIEEAQSIHLFNRTKAHAEALKAHIEQFYTTPIYVHEEDEKVDETYCLVIQTTGVGMGKHKEDMPICTQKVLEGATYAVDLIYNPVETCFLRYAKSVGCHCINGFGMLFYQAVKAYEYMHKCSCNKAEVIKVKQQLEKELLETE